MSLFAPPETETRREVTTGRILLDVTIPGQPVGAARPRVVRLKNGHSHTFMPDKSVRAEGEALRDFRSAWLLPTPLDEPVSIEVTVVQERPKRLMRRADPKGRIPSTGRGDVDNFGKLQMDALTKAGVLRDDSIVCRLIVTKWFTAIGEQPHVRTVVRVPA